MPFLGSFIPVCFLGAVIFQCPFFGDQCHGIRTVLVKRGETKINKISTNYLQISDDLKYIDTYISDGINKGVWINVSTLGDFKKAYKSLHNFGFGEEG